MTERRRKGWTPWKDGRRAWSRLEAWGPGEDGSRSGIGVDPEEALRALSDVGLIRRLLDQAELSAVRASRIHGKSWAEIATRLGVTRQSAWERWRDLDQPEVARPREMVSPVEGTIAAASGEAVAAAEGRRRATVRVPSVVGMPWETARQVLFDHHLDAVGPDPDGLPLATLGRPGAVVADQIPESGAMAAPGSAVRLWLEDGGGGEAGVREPRRPSPKPKSARELLYEPSDEAVG